MQRSAMPRLARSCRARDTLAPRDQRVAAAGMLERSSMSWRRSFMRRSRGASSCGEAVAERLGVGRMAALGAGFFVALGDVGARVGGEAARQQRGEQGEGGQSYDHGSR